MWGITFAMNFEVLNLYNEEIRDRPWTTQS